MWCAGTSSWRTRTRYSRWSMAMRRACADSWPVRRTDRRGRLAQGQRARIRRQTGPSPSSGARACSSPLAHGIGRPWTREQPLTRRGRRVVTLADTCAVAALRLQLEGGLEDAHEQPRGRVRSGQCRCGLPVPGRVRVSGFGTDLQRPVLPGAHLGTPLPLRLRGNRSSRVAGTAQGPALFRHPARLPLGAARRAARRLAQPGVAGHESGRRAHRKAVVQLRPRPDALGHAGKNFTDGQRIKRKAASWGRYGSGAHSVQPVAMSVRTSVCTKLPLVTGPLCATRSASTNPGGGSSQSENVRTGILRRTDEGAAVRRRRLPPACSRTLRKRPVDGRSAHGQQRGADLRPEPEMAVPLHRLRQRRRQRLQVLRRCGRMPPKAPPAPRARRRRRCAGRLFLPPWAPGSCPRATRASRASDGSLQWPRIRRESASSLRGCRPHAFVPGRQRSRLAPSCSSSSFHCSSKQPRGEHFR